MNELKKYNELKASKQKEMSDLLNKVQNEERAFTSDEDEKFDSLKAEIESINSTVKKINESRELLKEDESTEENKEENKKIEENSENKESEERALEEFGEYIRNQMVEKREGNTNFTVGENGVIIPTTIADKIITEAVDLSPVLDKCTYYNVKGKLSIPVYGTDENGKDITIGYAEDFKALTEAAGKFTSVTLEDHLIGALTKIGNSLINNTNIDLATKVISIMAEYVRIFLEKQILVGTNDKIEGCRGIKKIHEIAEPVITADDLIKLKNKVKQVFRKGSFYVMNQDTLTMVELLKDAQDRLIFHEDASGEFDGMIYGYPVYVSDNMPDVKKGARPIIFGNFSGIALKKSKDLEMKVLDQTYATEHATGIVAYLEADAKVEHVQKLAALDIKEA